MYVNSFEIVSAPPVHSSSALRASANIPSWPHAFLYFILFAASVTILAVMDGGVVVGGVGVVVGGRRPDDDDDDVVVFG
jgi:hypothetical protein